MPLPLSVPVDPDALQGQAQRDQPLEPKLQKRFLALQKARAAGDDEAAQVIAQGIREATGELRTREATAGMSGSAKFLAGAGAGARRVAEGAADMVSLGSRKHDPQADEDRKLAEDQLKATDEGAAGSLAGETGALAPLGLGAGAALRKLGAGATGMGLKAAGKLLTSTPVRGALEGAVAGAASAEPGERGEGAAAGGAVGGALSLGAKLLRRVGWKGAVQPAPAAARLGREGVDLTLGQMNPTGKLAQLEEASQSAGGFGRTIENQRMAGRESWQDAAMRKGVPPGGKLPERAPGNMASRLDEMYKGFEQPYQAAVKGEVVYPATHGKTPTPLQSTATGKPGAFDLAVMDPSALATDQERQAAKKFLDHQLSILPGGTTRPAMLQQVPAEQLQQVRSNIRGAVRQAASSGDLKLAKLLSNAEKQVGEALDTQLKNPELLRQTDRQYARYKTVEGAQASANDAPGGFTPSQLLRSVKTGMDKGLFARGGGGDLRRLATAGRDVLDARVPATGARMLTHTVPAAVGAVFGGAPGAAAGAAAGPTMTAGALALANKSPIKRFLTGQTRPQRAAQMLETALRRQLGPGGRQKAQDYAALAAALYGARQSKETR